MRLLAPVAFIGSFLLVTGVEAQSLAEHAAAASGATIGTAAGKPLSNAITKIFGQTENSAKKASNATVPAKSPAKSTVEAAPVIQAPQGGGGPSISTDGVSVPSRHGGFRARPASHQYTSSAVVTPAVAVVSIPEPPRKEPTAEELASIRVGATESEMVKTLGQPESKVTIPDDGHLLQICQYWSKGKQLGTVRLDNGQVVNVESRSN